MEEKVKRETREWEVREVSGLEVGEVTGGEGQKQDGK